MPVTLQPKGWVKLSDSTREVNREGKIVPLTLQDFTGYVTAAGVGTGAPVFAEVAATGLAGLRFEAVGDMVHTMWKVPYDMDIDFPLKVNLIFSSDQTTTTDTFDWIVTYQALTLGTTVPVTAVTALDTAITTGTANNSGADVPQETGEGTINGSTFSEGQWVNFRVELDAVSGATLATDIVALWAMELHYTQKYFN